MDKCKVISCNEHVRAIGLCEKHYRRFKKHGTCDDSVGKTAPPDGYVKRENHPAYGIWRNITRFKGGAFVCDEWKSFEGFVGHIKERPSANHCLVRIDKNGMFSPENCTWRINKQDSDKAAYARRWRASAKEADPRKFLNYQLMMNYGITVDNYESMVAEQNNLCAICGKPESRTDKEGNPKRLCVDHCHNAGGRRGLLCSACNTALGLFKDDVSILQSAIAYLNSHKQLAPTPKT